jgi:hypothetical protein
MLLYWLTSGGIVPFDPGLFYAGRSTSSIRLGRVRFFGWWHEIFKLS